MLQELAAGVFAAADEEVGAEGDVDGGAEVQGAYGDEQVGWAGLFQDDHERHNGGVVGGWLGACDQQAAVHDLVAASVAWYLDNLFARHPISLTDFAVPPRELSTTLAPQRRGPALRSHRSFLGAERGWRVLKVERQPAASVTSGLSKVPTNWSEPATSVRSTICWLFFSCNLFRHDSANEGAKMSYFANAEANSGVAAW
ncbi:hypothetical protein EV646_10895 [Kribbella antiqua]|uniref:Uncharacterized protein n=1 Tax=Kribbella antiqua TaxID=2512217 RepID=A0A4R2IKG2_9ACTN|nr:hypothetical protein EV646_10895 [Kribbella antiqua]